MTREEAHGIALRAALKARSGSARDAADPAWEPEDWIVEALLAAANRPARDLPPDDATTYEVLSRPVPQAEAEDACRAFFDAVAAARIEHGMPDVQVIVQARVTSPAGPRPVIASMYWGDPQANQLVLLARKYGEARAAHEYALGDLIEQGRRSVVERLPGGSR